jgi:hypothetical protein
MAEARSLRLRLGPLRYLLLAHDHWGERTIERLRDQADCRSFEGRALRTIHLLREGDAKPPDRPSEGKISRALARLLPQGAPRDGWSIEVDSTLAVTVHHPRLSHSFWMLTARVMEGRLRFRLPWQILIPDIIGRGGGVLHAGLARSSKRTYLFAAPSGGGKSTALARLPSTWRVEADDAVLIWPGRGSAFYASPLPTWSVMSGRNPKPPWLSRWRPGRSLKVDEIVILEKAQYLKRSKLGAVEAAPMLYRAFCDHPETNRARHFYRRDLFLAACAVARALPASVLRLGLRDRFWRLLA